MRTKIGSIPPPIFSYLKLIGDECLPELVTRKSFKGVSYSFFNIVLLNGYGKIFSVLYCVMG